ncbi:uncharacterized protein ACIBXB_011076 [Morphnus guianensis]
MAALDEHVLVRSTSAAVETHIQKTHAGKKKRKKGKPKKSQQQRTSRHTNVYRFCFWLFWFLVWLFFFPFFFFLPCLKTGSAPSVLVAWVIFLFVWYFWLAGLFILLLLQYSACLPERHGLFLRLRLLRGRRSAAARWWPGRGGRAGAARPAGRLPPRLASSPLPAPLASPWSTAGLPSPALPLPLPGSLSVPDWIPARSLAPLSLSLCLSSVLYLPHSPAVLSVCESLPLPFSLSPRPRSVVRLGPETAARFVSLLAGSALAALSAAAPARADSAAPTAASQEPLAPPPLPAPNVPPPRARPYPTPHRHTPPADCAAGPGRGAARPGSVCCLCVGWVCLSVCLSVRPSVCVASRTPATPVTLLPPPHPTSPPSPPRQPTPGQEQRQSTRTGLALKCRGPQLAAAHHHPFPPTQGTQLRERTQAASGH